MDYARLALLKAEELEQSINKKNETENKISSKNLIANTFLEKNENYILFNINAKNNLGIIVNLFLEGVEGSKISLFINRRKVQVQDYAEKLSFMVSVPVSENIEISVSCSENITILRADTMLIGEGEFLNSSNKLSLDYAFNKLGVVTSYENQIKLYILDDVNNPKLENHILMGFGFKADICSINYNGSDCFAVLYIDLEKNAILNIVRKSGVNYELLESNCLFNGVDDISIATQDNDLIIGLIKDSNAYANNINPLNKSLGQSIERAERINLVKNTYPLATIISKDGKNIIRVSLRQLNSAETIKLRLLVI